MEDQAGYEAKDEPWLNQLVFLHSIQCKYILLFNLLHQK